MILRTTMIMLTQPCFHNHACAKPSTWAFGTTTLQCVLSIVMKTVHYCYSDPAAVQWSSRTYPVSGQRFAANKPPFPLPPNLWQQFSTLTLCATVFQNPHRSAIICGLSAPGFFGVLPGATSGDVSFFPEAEYLAV